MSILRRRQRQPEVAALAAAYPDERVLAWAQANDGRWVVATDTALHVPGPTGDSQRLPWETLQQATWSRDDSRLVVTAVEQGQRHPYRFGVVIEDPGDLATVVRERVNASVVIAREITVDGRPVRVVGRRRPGQDGLLWTVTVDRRLDLGDPAVKERVDAAVALVRAEVET